MNESTLLRLPYIIPAQAQKHVTHNEALRILDTIVQLSVLTRSLLAPPQNVENGDRFIVASTASGDWAGHENEVASFQDDNWEFYPPQQGWLAWVRDENQFYVYANSIWIAYTGNVIGASVTLNKTLNGAETRFELIEEELVLAGSFVDSTIIIPDRAVVFGVSALTTETITGASSYDCGIEGETSKFGGSLGLALGSSNSGVIGPTAFYADTKIILTANGSAFTAGRVRIAIHYMLCSAANT